MTNEFGKGQSLADLSKVTDGAGKKAVQSGLVWMGEDGLGHMSAKHVDSRT